MKQNTIIRIVIILGIAAAISYGIIWYRKRQAAAGTAPGSSPANADPATTLQTGATGTGYPLPEIHTYDWWIKKVGHAQFPLTMSSKGVEVVKVQEVLNEQSAKKGLSPITVDGIWGFNTNARVKLIYPEFGDIPQTVFAIYFDPNREILK